MPERSETLTRGRTSVPATLLPPAAPSGQAPLYPDIGIISPVLSPYGEQWTSRHQVLTRLARYFHVIWLPPAPEWREALRRRRLRWRRDQAAGQGDGFVVFEAPSWLPKLYRPRWAADALARTRLHAARAELVRRGCTRIVLYLWHIARADTLELVEHDLSVYHIYDEYSHSEVEQPLDPVELRVIRSVDQVITVSPAMFERKGRTNPNSIRLTNGVEFDAFATPTPEPSDLTGIPHPRVGYSGFIKKQLDWELLSTLAARHPGWSFVFVGAMRPHPEIEPVLRRMAELSNVYFLGAKSSSELASYPQHFDVCLMPYRVNEYTKYIYPLKLHEYLASGRPTVSAPIPALDEVADLVAAANGVEEWEREIARALAPEANTQARGAARQAVARQHDWNIIVGEIGELILRRLSPGTEGA